MKDGYVDITAVLDRSGSMTSVQDDTIGGYNTYIKGQKEDNEGTVTFTLIQFDDRYEVHHNGVAIADVPDLSRDTFKPRGGTALLDALGRAINEAGARFAAMDESQRPEKVIFVILTDGDENSSKLFTREQIFEKIKHQTEVYSWEFIFIGANQDAISAGASIGISAGKSLSYASNAIGTASAFDSVTRITKNYRSKLYDQTDFTESERLTQFAAGATPSAAVAPVAPQPAVTLANPQSAYLRPTSKLVNP